MPTSETCGRMQGSSRASPRRTRARDHIEMAEQWERLAEHKAKLEKRQGPMPLGSTRQSHDKALKIPNLYIGTIRCPQRLSKPPCRQQIPQFSERQRSAVRTDGEIRYSGICAPLVCRREYPELSATDARPSALSVMCLNTICSCAELCKTAHFVGLRVNSSNLAPYTSSADAQRRKHHHAGTARRHADQPSGRRLLTTRRGLQRPLKC